MAEWTTPKTMIPGAAALAADWNTYIRDNTEYLDDRVQVLYDHVQVLDDRIQILTQAEYDAITPDPDTIYFVVD